MEYCFDEYGNELPQEPKTVSQINEYIKNLIEEEVVLQDLLIIGEISNFKHHSSGHMYFTLKDDNSEIRAVMFKANAIRVKFKIENGLKVLIKAKVGVFEKAGAYQLYVTSIQPDGIGALYLAYEQLKEKLSKEGLFEDVRKKPIPKFPSRIGIITSPTGAAIQDIINIATRRNPGVNLLIFPSLVQGSEAPIELISGIDYFNITNSVDVIIIGRGGGSIEDLWAFNDEGLARAIYNSNIPVISSVGHEIDYTICDFVSDLRAPTPSAAAELATPNIIELRDKILSFKNRSVSAINKKTSEMRTKLNYISNLKVFISPLTMLENPKISLTYAQKSLLNAFEKNIVSKRNDFTKTVTKINALNPLNVLSRGYAIVSNEKEHSINSINNFDIQSTVNIRFTDGTATARIISKEGIK